MFIFRPIDYFQFFNNDICQSRANFLSSEIVRIPVDERMFSSGFMSQQQFTLAQHHSQPTSFYQNQGFYQNSLTHVRTKKFVLILQGLN